MNERVRERERVREIRNKPSIDLSTIAVSATTTLTCINFSVPELLIETATGPVSVLEPVKLMLPSLEDFCRPCMIVF